MTPDQVRLVQDSFRAVVPIRVAAAAIFYERLFAIDAKLRTLFPATDMADQGKKLMASLGFVVHGLDRADTILPQVRALAKRHVNYGVKEHRTRSSDRRSLRRWRPASAQPSHRKFARLGRRPMGCSRA